MSNNITREEHLAALAIAARNFALAQGNILSTTPATVSGGIWYEVGDS